MIRVTRAQALLFTLQKSYLTNHDITDIPHIVSQLAGIPATTQTPLLALKARLSTATKAEITTDLTTNPNLIYGITLRSEAHLLNLADYVNHHTATARFRRQAFNAEFRTWGISNEDVESLSQQIGQIVETEPITQAEIISALPANTLQRYQQTTRGGRTSQTDNVALVLRWLVAQGVLYADPTPPTAPPLLRANQSPSPEPERTYVQLTHRYPNLDMSNLPSEASAQLNLVRHYIATYGPVTEADISFWSGLGKSETSRAVNRLSGETMLTMVEGIPGMLLTLKSQASALRAVEIPDNPMINMLPANDPLLIAHRASRQRYFADQKRQRLIFGNASTAKPTILLNGQTVGTWMETEKEYLHKIRFIA